MSEPLDRGAGVKLERGGDACDVPRELVEPLGVRGDRRLDGRGFRQADGQSIWSVVFGSNRAARRAGIEQARRTVAKEIATARRMAPDSSVSRRLWRLRGESEQAALVKERLEKSLVADRREADFVTHAVVPKPSTRP
jgi:hypothetical protein